MFERYLFDFLAAAFFMLGLTHAQECMNAAASKKKRIFSFLFGVSLFFTAVRLLRP